jgi:hypothetical protein
MSHYYLGNKIDEKYRVRIYLHNGKGEQSGFVEGNLQNDFSVSGSNSFDEQGAHIESVVSSVPVVGQGVHMKRAGESIASAGTGANQFLTQIGSQLTWQGSKSSALNIELTFVCLNSDAADQDVPTRVNTIMRAVYPEIEENKTGGLLFRPPMGYSTEVFGRDKNNVLSLRSVSTNNGKSILEIGDWFRAEYLVIEDVQFSFSKELNKNGRPIYAVGSVAMRPYKTLTYKEYLGWFKSGSYK